jgi:hypothetical protein
MSYPGRGPERAVRTARSTRTITIVESGRTAPDTCQHESEDSSQHLGMTAAGSDAHGGHHRDAGYVQQIPITLLVSRGVGR